MTFVYPLQPLTFADRGVALAQALGENPEHVARHRVRGMHQRPEALLIHGQQHRGGIGHDPGGRRLVIDDGQFPDALATLEHGEWRVVRRVEVHA